MRRGAGWKLGIWVGIALFIGLLIADNLSLTRPGISAPGIVRAMTKAWEQSRGYQADITVGQNSKDVSFVQNCRQWFNEDVGLVFAAKNAMGVFRMEKWSTGKWMYYQGGPYFLLDVDVRNEETRPFARWRHTRFPTVGELVSVIGQARELEYVRSSPKPEGEDYIIECQPQMPAGTADATEAERAFYNRYFTRRWQVWVASTTHMPMHIYIGPPEEAPLRLGIENYRKGPINFPPDWKTIGGMPGEVKERVVLQCDLRSDQSIAEVRAKADSRMRKWEKNLKKRFATPDPQSNVPL